MASARVSIAGLAREVGLARPDFKNGGFWLRFICPRCSRRVRVLRLHEGEVKCWRCVGLPYTVEHLSKPERARRRIARLLEQLNAPAVRLNPRKAARSIDEVRSNSR
jgi:hypothetical protein